jgi:hypothetical protein
LLKFSFFLGFFGFEEIGSSELGDGFFYFSFGSCLDREEDGGSVGVRERRSAVKGGERRRKVRK